MLQARKFFTHTINILRCDQWCGFSLLFLYFPKSQQQETTSTYELSVWVSEIPEIMSFTKTLLFVISNVIMSYDARNIYASSNPIANIWSFLTWRNTSLIKFSIRAMQVAAQRKKFAVAYQKYPYGPEASARTTANYTSKTVYSAVSRWLSSTHHSQTLRV